MECLLCKLPTSNCTRCSSCECCSVRDLLCLQNTSSLSAQCRPDLGGGLTGVSCVEQHAEPALRQRCLDVFRPVIDEQDFARSDTCLILRDLINALIRLDDAHVARFDHD